jgi:FRG domain-containing protein
MDTVVSRGAGVKIQDCAASETFRPKMPMSERLHCEQELRAEFRRQAAQLPLYKPADSWEWYFLMQHYGVPTRLLDWTDGILIGLHFAISSRGGKNDSLGETDAAVYLLDPWLLDIGAFAKYRTEIEGVALSEWRETKPYLPLEMKSETLRPEIPLAIDPAHIAARVAAQRSHFTVFGRDLDGIRNLRVKIKRGEPEQDPLAKIIIDGTKIGSLKTELAICGVSEPTIFPDLEGLGRGLKQWWNSQCDYNSGT